MLGYACVINAVSCAPKKHGGILCKTGRLSCALNMRRGGGLGLQRRLRHQSGSGGAVRAHRSVQQSADSSSPRHTAHGVWLSRECAGRGKQMHDASTSRALHQHARGAEPVRECDGSCYVPKPEGHSTAPVAYGSALLHCLSSLMAAPAWLTCTGAAHAALLLCRSHHGHVGRCRHGHTSRCRR